MKLHKFNFKRNKLKIYLMIIFLVACFTIYNCNDIYSFNNNKSSGKNTIQVVSKNQLNTNLMLTKEEKDWLRNNKKATVAIMDDFPPFSFQSNGRLVGFSVDMFNLLEEKTGLEFEIISDSWSKILEKFKNKEVDMIDGISYKKERTSFTLYTTPYYQIPIVIYTRDNAKWYKSIKDLSGKKVGIAKDYFYKSELEKIKNIELIEKLSNEKTIKLLAFEKIDAAITNSSIGDFFIKKNAFTNIKVADEYISKNIKREDLAIGIRNDKEILRDIIQKGLNALSEKEIMKLKSKWVGTYVPDKQESSMLKLSKAEEKFIEENQVIKVSSQTDWPPFDFTIDHQPFGLSIDIMNIVAKRLGIKFEYVNGYTWNQLIGMLKNKEIDILQSAYKNKSRQEYGLFTEPYYRDRNIFIIHEDAKEVHNIRQLYNKVVAIPKGWAYQTYLDKYHPQIHLLLVNNMKEALQLVEEGKADATIELSAVAKYLIEKNFYKGLKLSGWFKEYDQGEFKSLHMLVRKDYTVLHGMVEKALKTITPDELIKLEEKWLGDKRTKGIRPLILTKEEEEFLEEHRVIRVANEMDWPPFDFVEDSKPQGFSIAYLELVGDIVGIEFDFVNGYSWSELLEQGKNKKVDLFPVLYKSKDREKFLKYTNPYVDLIEVLVVRKDMKGIDSFNDLKGKEIALSQGYTSTKIIMDNYKNYNYVIVKNPEEGLKKLAMGKVDGFVGSLGVVNYIIENKFIDNLKIVAEINLDDDLLLYMAVREDWEILRDIINKAMIKVEEDDYDAIFKEWIGSSKISGGLDNLSEEERKYLRNKKEILISANPDYLPFEKINKNGEYKGIVAQFYKLLSEKIGIPIKLVKTNSWKESLVSAQNKKCDILSAIVDQEDKEKSKYLNFTSSYVEYPFVIVTRNEEIYINKLEAVLDKKIGIVRKQRFLESLKDEYPEINLIEVENVKDGLTKVQKGEIFGFIDISPVVGYVIQEERMFDLKISGELSQNLSFRIGVRKDDQVLLNILEKAVKSLNDEEKKSIFQNWMSIKYERGFNYYLLRRIVAIVILIALFFLYHNQKLSKVNEELAMANEKLADMSYFDGLTEIPNRRRFNQVLEREWRRSIRNKVPLSVIMIDIDYFKQYNDNYGHLTGDDCLKKLAKTLSITVKRGGDFVARYGGEEFVVILANTDEKGAKKVAWTIREEVKKMAIPHHYSKVANHITVSLGTATVVDSSQFVADELVNTADKMLYKAKEGGRDRVESTEL